MLNGQQTEDGKVDSIKPIRQQLDQDQWQMMMEVKIGEVAGLEGYLENRLCRAWWEV